MARRLLFRLLLLAFFASPLAGQIQTRDYYSDPEDARGCIGGSRCGGSRAVLRIRLDDRPVSIVKFRAHDDIGGSRNGRLRVRIDSRVIEPSVDISRSPETYTIDAGGVRGRELVLEPASNDEVEVTDVSVRYGGDLGDGGLGGGGSHEGGCIGGRRCGGSRSSLRIPLRDRPLREIRFYAHDDMGDSRNGRLRVRVDSASLESSLDVSRSRELYTIDGRGARGRELVFEPASDDEVEVSDVRVIYRDGGGVGGGVGGGWGGIGGGDSEGGCIGGRRCGGSGAAIRIPLQQWRPLREVTFTAHDDIGDSRDGRVLVRVDRTFERSLDVSRSRERYTVELDGIRGRELVFEPASNDEVEVRDIQIRYR